EDRKREGGGLAGAGLGDALQVAAFHDAGDGLGLDRRGDGVALVRQRLQEGLGEAEVDELGQTVTLRYAPNAPARSHRGRGVAGLLGSAPRDGRSMGLTALDRLGSDENPTRLERR